ncbi:MAG: hypothetical protein ACE5EC_04405 [Phycisphaerae bacterium]
MAKKYVPIDLSRLKTYSIRNRSHKCDVDKRARLPEKGASFSQWWQSLPSYLGVREIQALAEAIIAARHADRPVAFALGAHVVKVGCSPVVCDLIRQGIVTAVVMNGATAIHDIEVALFGRTSEEVAETIRDGRFGMVEETPAFFAEALRGEADEKTGLGERLAAHVNRTDAPHADYSILAAADRARIPATVHVAWGTDTIHMHAAVDGSDLLHRSRIDFRIACSVLADMAPAGPDAPAGVWCNIGSSVILPEVFLKALAVARNLGGDLDGLVTADLDMIRHYRPSQNVVGRTVRPGHGHRITGHHEIMIPMLRQALIELI